jgi:hypothetical protein
MTIVVLPNFEDETSHYSVATEYLHAAEILIETPVAKINASLVTFFHLVRNLKLGQTTTLILPQFVSYRGAAVELLRIFWCSIVAFDAPDPSATEQGRAC